MQTVFYSKDAKKQSYLYKSYYKISNVKYAAVLKGDVWSVYFEDNFKIG
ncbi:hypothetical protein [uncultured Polaribacter sp.]|nr:hypothetical protein [uncultured Polaribacter sp.]